jgi:replicative superfamily II helicase
MILIMVRFQAFQHQSAAFANKVSKYCQIFEPTVLGAALNELGQRLKFASKGELISLQSLPNVNRRIARALYNSGKKSPKDVSRMNIDQLNNIVQTVEKDDNQLMKDKNCKAIAEAILKEATLFTNSSKPLEEMGSQPVIYATE